MVVADIAESGGLYGEPIETYKDGIPNWLRLVVKHLELRKILVVILWSKLIILQTSFKVVPFQVLLYSAAGQC